VTLSVTLAGRGKAGKALAFSAAVAGEGGPMKRLTSRVSVRR
jgi:hypothetical protein